MQSGLGFSEIYDQISDATNMLYGAEDVSDIPINNASIAPPDSLWYYSSGTSNLLSKYLNNQFANQEDYLKFPHERLFRKIGMSTAHLETDESGVYIGSSYLYATPRDWARFGLLYLNEGNWFGEQIIDTTWVDFSQSIAPQSGGIYGGHFWHNEGHAQFKDVPDDMFSANGFQGQRVWIFPTQDVVVVRMGLAGDDLFDMNEFLKEVLEAFD
jgi:CubicO group peptidase (beta-lactamase class C family)